MAHSSVSSQGKAPACNILSYVLSNNTPRQWTSTINPSKGLTTSSARTLIHRLGSGFDRMGIPKQTAVMVIGSQDNIYLPTIYLAVAGSGRIFTIADPGSSVTELARQMKIVQPSLVLTDPSTALEKAIEAVEQSGTNRDRIFSFEEEDWSDPRNGILDWKILMARQIDGRQWQWDHLDEKTARETIAFIDFSGHNAEGTRVSHHDILTNALEFGRDRSDFDPWSAVLPWKQTYNRSKVKL